MRQSTFFVVGLCTILGRACTTGDERPDAFAQAMGSSDTNKAIDTFKFGGWGASGTGSALVFADRGGLMRAVAFDYGESGLDLFTIETDGPTTYRWQWSATTAFQIQGFAARHADELFLGGIDPSDGDIVIERWAYSAQTGGYGSSMPAASGGIGTSAPYDWPTVSVVGGGALVPPASRPAPLPPNKIQVYRGTHFASIGGLVVDPDRRFVLVKDGATGSIYQIEPNQPPTLLCSATAISNVGDAILCQPYQKGTSDRVYAFSLFGHGQTLILHDGDNDGSFDPPYVIDDFNLSQSFVLNRTGEYNIVR